MEGPIQRAQEIRRRAASARADAESLRRQSADLVERARRARIAWTAQREKFIDSDLRPVPLERMHRYVVLVNAVQIEGWLLRKGDVVTDELVPLDYRALLEQRLIEPWDYRLSDLQPSNDPWWDGKGMG